MGYENFMFWLNGFLCAIETLKKDHVKIIHQKMQEVDSSKDLDVGLLTDNIDEVLTQVKEVRQKIKEE